MWKVQNCTKKISNLFSVLDFFMQHFLRYSSRFPERNFSSTISMILYRSFPVTMKEKGRRTFPNISETYFEKIRLQLFRSNPISSTHHAGELKLKFNNKNNRVKSYKSTLDHFAFCLSIVTVKCNVITRRHIHKLMALGMIAQLRRARCKNTKSWSKGDK